MISSLGFNQHEILKDILKLHVGEPTFHLDVCFGNGQFYKGIPVPKLCYDISPSRKGVKPADCTKLPIKTGVIRSVIFDPPFICGHTKTGKSGIIKSRFSSFRKVPELWGFYNLALVELYRVLKDKGVLVFKCQDTVEDHKNFFSHVEIMVLAVKVGFYPKDLFILGSNHRMIRTNQVSQSHARKYHSYFWVFNKTVCKVPYTHNSLPKTSTPSHGRLS